MVRSAFDYVILAKMRTRKGPSMYISWGHGLYGTGYVPGRDHCLEYSLFHTGCVPTARMSEEENVRDVPIP